MKGKNVITNAARRPKLSFVFDEYQVRNRVRNLSPATLKGYQETYNRFSAFFGQDIECHTVSIKVVEVFIAKLMDDGIKSASINHYLRSIRSFLYWCMSEEYVQQFKIRLVKEQETIKKTYSDEQIRLLIREPLKQASFVEWRCWAMVCWFLATGNRAETACSIKIGDLDFSSYEIQINRTKTNKAMILPMSNGLYMVLRKYMSLFRMDALSLCHCSTTVTADLHHMPYRRHPILASGFFRLPLQSVHPSLTRLPIHSKTSYITPVTLCWRISINYPFKHKLFYDINIA